MPLTSVWRCTFEMRFQSGKKALWALGVLLASQCCSICRRARVQFTAIIEAQTAEITHAESSLVVLVGPLSAPL